MADLEGIRNPAARRAVILDPDPAEYDRMRRQVDDLAARVNELAVQQHTQSVRVHPESVLHRLASK